MKKFEFPLGHYYVTTDPEKPNPILYANIQRAIFARGGEWLHGNKSINHLDMNDTYIKFNDISKAEFSRDRPKPFDEIKPAIDLIKVLFQVGDKIKYRDDIYTITKTPTHGSMGIFIQHHQGEIRLSVAEGVDLIPSDTKPKEKTYLEIHKESGLKVGDKVKIVKEVPSEDKGWSAHWEKTMSKRVGETGIIDEDGGNSGFGVRFSDENISAFYYPAHALEKVEDTNYIVNGSTNSFRYKFGPFPLTNIMPWFGIDKDQISKADYFKIPTTHSGDIAPKHLKLKKVKIKQVPLKGLDVAKKKSNLLQDKLSKKLKQKEKENEKNRTARKW